MNPLPQPAHPTVRSPGPPSPLRRSITVHALEAILDTFAPRGCLACDAEVPNAVLRAFCGSCTLALEPGEPWAPYRYGGAIQTAIVRLKYRDRTDLAGPLGRTMARWADERRLVDAGALVVPVASSPERVATRGYCHASLLARAVGGELGLRVEVGGLERIYQGKTQKEGTRDERLAALEGAYRGSPAVAGRNVLLVDDVVTTGATIHAARAALRAAGAKRVQPLVLAWTPAFDEGAGSPYRAQ